MPARMPRARRAGARRRSTPSCAGASPSSSTTRAGRRSTRPRGRRRAARPPARQAHARRGAARRRGRAQRRRAVTASPLAPRSRAGVALAHVRSPISRRCGSVAAVAAMLRPRAAGARRAGVPDQLRQRRRRQAEQALPLLPDGRRRDVPRVRRRGLRDVAGRSVRHQPAQLVHRHGRRAARRDQRRRRSTTTASSTSRSCPTQTAPPATFPRRDDVAIGTDDEHDRALGPGGPRRLRRQRRTPASAGCGAGATRTTAAGARRRARTARTRRPSGGRTRSAGRPRTRAGHTYGLSHETTLGAGRGHAARPPRHAGGQRRESASSARATGGTSATRASRRSPRTSGCRSRRCTTGTWSTRTRRPRTASG